MNELDPKEQAENDALIFQELANKYANMASGILEDIAILEGIYKKYSHIPEIAKPILTMLSGLKLIQETLWSEDNIRKYDDRNKNPRH